MTELSVDVDGLRKLLPANASVETLTWNPTTQKVEAVWSHRDLRTKYSIPTPFPLQSLHDRALPPGVEHKPVVIQGVPVTPQVQTNNDNANVIDTPKKGRKVKAQ